MDGDPSQEDRIRLIGRLFFQLGGRRLKLRSLSCLKVFSFMQDLGAPIEGVFHIDVTPTSVTSLSIWPSDGLRCLRMVGNDAHLK